MAKHAKYKHVKVEVDGRVLFDADVVIPEGLRCVMVQPAVRRHGDVADPRTIELRAVAEPGTIDNLPPGQWVL